MGILIGFSGLANSGKDTCADYLAENYEFAKISLADPIKRMVMEIYDFSEEQLWGPSENRNKPDKRYIKECEFCSSTGKIKYKWHGKHSTRTCSMCDGEKQNLTPREALQKFGGVGRECWSETWLNICLKNAKKLLGNNATCYSRTEGVIPDVNVFIRKCVRGGVTIADARYRNELDAIREARGKLVRIKRPESGLIGDAAEHPSETEQQSIPDSYFDYIIDNNGSLDELYNKIKYMYNSFK